jgi:hypothetical protein
MAAKRPAYTTIRARQRRIVDYMASTGKGIKPTAKEFDVKPRELRGFLETKPKKLRKSYNRSPVTKKLVAEAGEREVRAKVAGEKAKYRRVSGTVADIRFYRETPGIDPELRRRRIIELERVRYVRTDKEYRSTNWAFYADRRNIPVSIRAIREMHDNGDIDDDMFDDIIDAWEEIYDTTYGNTSAA